jgi:hypothetical protein
MPWRRVVAALIGTGLALAACSDGDDGTVTAPEPNVRVISTTSSSTVPPSTTATSTSTTAASTTSTADASTSTTGTSTTTSTTADVPGTSNLTATDRISTVGLGPVFVGMTVAEATQAAGSPFERLTPDLGPCTMYQATDFKDAGVRWLVAFDRIAVIHVDKPGVVTRSGLGVGSSAADVRARFGEQVTERPSPYDAAVTELVFTPLEENEARQRVIFDVDGSGQVVRFRSGQLPEVDYSANCDR